MAQAEGRIIYEALADFIVEGMKRQGVEEAVARQHIARWNAGKPAVGLTGNGIYGVIRTIFEDMEAEAKRAAK